MSANPPLDHGETMYITPQNWVMDGKPRPRNALLSCRCPECRRTAGRSFWIMIVLGSVDRPSQPSISHCDHQYGVDLPRNWAFERVTP